MNPRPAPSNQDTSSAQDAPSAPTQMVNGRFLRALYHDLYGRAPLIVERKEWLGKPLDDWIASALTSEPAWRHWLDEQLYYFMLIDEFEPVKTSLDELPGQLVARRISPRDALHRIALCTSFEQRNPGADTFVTVVMEQFCGMEVQRSARELEIGKNAYDGGAGTFLGSKASSQSDVIQIAVTHKQGARHLAAREYERLCRQPCSKRERGLWGKRIQKKPRELFRLYAEWLGSPAYAERVERGAPLSNRAWVQSVYVDLGDTLPEPGDARALGGALDSLGDPAPLRSLIVRMLLDHDGTRAPRRPEVSYPGAWVDEKFARLLGRGPTPLEHTEFVKVCGASADGPELVLYALLTSQEYQSA